MKNALGDSYFLGNVYGTLLNDAGSNEYFDVWTPRAWHSICISLNKKKLHVFVDDLLVVKSSLKFDFFSVFTGNVTLMKDFQNNTIRSKISDVQIWKKQKLHDFIKKWSKCKTNEEGDIFKWSLISVTTESIGVNIEDEDVDFCPDKTRYLAFKVSKKFEEVQRWCNRLEGKIAVAYDARSLDKMKLAGSLDKCPKGFFVGYQKIEDVWRT